MSSATSRITRRRLLGASGTVVALAASPLVPPPLAIVAQTPAIATPPTDKLEAAITSTMDALAIPGANVLVDRPGMETWTVGFGVSDLQSAAPMHADLHMRIGSVTKTMTATVVLQLADENALTLDDTLATLLPDWSTIPNAEAVTVRHLLSMRSGVFDHLEDESVFDQIMSDPGREWTPDEMVSITAAHDAEFAPGADFNYSNTNYILLGLIVERLTKRPIAEELDQRLFAPLGMAETSLPSRPEMPASYARGYSVDPTVTEVATPAAGEAPPLSVNGIPLIDWTALNPTVAWAAGGVVSTIGDLHIWLQALIGGSLISTELQRERLAFEPVERDPGEPSYGYGLGLADYDGVIGHDGSILGYHSFAGHVQETGASVIVLTNLDPAMDKRDSATEIAQAVVNVLKATP